MAVPLHVLQAGAWPRTLDKHACMTLHVLQAGCPGQAWGGGWGLRPAGPEEERAGRHLHVHVHPGTRGRLGRAALHIRQAAARGPLHFPRRLQPQHQRVGHQPGLLVCACVCMCVCVVWGVGCRVHGHVYTLWSSSSL